MATEKTTLSVEGMHCNSCAMNITLELEDLVGVSSVSARFDTGAVDVEYDPEKVGLEQINKVIDSLGFKVVA